MKSAVRQIRVFIYLQLIPTVATNVRTIVENDLKQRLAY
jgi:hypothetical protein